MLLWHGSDSCNSGPGAVCAGPCQGASAVRWVLDRVGWTVRHPTRLRYFLRCAATSLHPREFHIFPRSSKELSLEVLSEACSSADQAWALVKPLIPMQIVWQKQLCDEHKTPEAALHLRTPEMELKGCVRSRSFCSPGF